MKDVRFYEEFTDKRKGVSAGNVFAAFPEIAGFNTEGLGAVFEHPNSPVAGTAVSREFLRTKCKRVSEQRAREVHPALFERLDS